MGLHTLGAEEFFTEGFGFFGVVPCAGKNIQINGFFIFRKVRSDGTGFDKLYERVAGGNRIIMSEMGNECFSIAFHMDHVITQCNDKFFDFAAGRNFFKITIVEIQDELLPKKIFLFFISCIYHYVIYNTWAMNDEQELISLSSLDGRYAWQTAALREYFSEFAYIQYRVRVEIRYLLFLSKWKIIRALTKREKTLFEQIADSFNVADAAVVKKFESETKHDVKAIEYFLKEKLAGTSCKDILPFVHFGLTSEDVNNLAYGAMLTGAHNEIILPEVKKIPDDIQTISRINKSSFMLARTHGQPAVPTTFGKELVIFYARISKLEKRLKSFKFEGKLNGAVGNYNALVFAFPKTDWLRFSKEFISSFNLIPNLMTTQILPADNFVEYSLLLFQLNTILIGFCQDMWMYIVGGWSHKNAIRSKWGRPRCRKK